MISTAGSAIRALELVVLDAQFESWLRFDWPEHKHAPTLTTRQVGKRIVDPTSSINAVLLSRPRSKASWTLLGRCRLMQGSFAGEPIGER